MNGAQIVVEPTATGVAIEFAHSPIVIDLGVGIPLQARWRWSFDGTLHRGAPEHARGSDLLGEFESLVFIYADEAGPLVRQAVKSYQGHACVVVETTALREIRGTFLEDSFFNTTFNSPVVRLGPGLNYLVYTWGLLGDEGPGIGATSRTWRWPGIWPLCQNSFDWQTSSQPRTSTRQPKNPSLR